MARFALAMAVALLDGCSSAPIPISDLATPIDMASPVDAALPPADVAVAASAIGGPCRTVADCGEGTSPTCWRSSLYNMAGWVATPEGYCSSKCNDDGDCGASGVCIDEGANGKWCFAPCGVPGDCRTGYGCFIHQAGHCFPSGDLECDPTAGDGTCANGKACWRSAVGPGKTGYCQDTCDIGVGTCPPNGGIRQCVVFDFRPDKDLQGNLTGDKFYGPICTTSYSQNAEGTECSYKGRDFSDACVDGDECDLTQGGDRKCHRLCQINGGIDGGVVVGCPAMQACKNAFGLLGTGKPIGLCE